MLAGHRQGRAMQEVAICGCAGCPVGGPRRGVGPGSRSTGAIAPASQAGSVRQERWIIRLGRIGKGLTRLESAGQRCRENSLGTAVLSDSLRRSPAAAPSAQAPRSTAPRGGQWWKSNQLRPHVQPRMGVGAPSPSSNRVRFESELSFRSPND
jgi:hypothetical protein